MVSSTMSIWPTKRPLYLVSNYLQTARLCVKLPSSPDPLAARPFPPEFLAPATELGARTN